MIGDIDSKHLHIGPPPSAALRMLMVMGRDRLGMMSSAAARYGDAVLLPVGHKELYFFNHPDFAKHVLADNSGNYHKGIGLVHARRALGDGLLTSEGELWRKQRSVIQPAFHTKRIAEHAGVIAEEAAAFVERLRHSVGGGPIPLARELTQLSLGVLGRTLLDVNLDSFELLAESFQSVQDQAMFELASLGTVPQWIPLPRQLRFRRARQYLQQVVDTLVELRHRDTDDRVDVLSRLIVSAGQEHDPRVGRSRLRDELVTILLAGHETTASTLSWTFHLLDEHPDVWLRLHTEARQALGDRMPTYDDLHRLPYATMVIEEAMRLFPPVWILPRKALDEDVIGGYRVPAGADVLICPFTLHRHPEFWTAPQSFDPERFGPQRAAERPRYAYIPFGAGPRFCVGSNLGLLEATLVVAMVARELRLTKVPGYRAVPEPMLSLRVRGGMPVTVSYAG